MRKSEWLALGRVFGAEIEGRHVLHSKANIYTTLERDGLVEMLKIRLGADRFGPIEVIGWALTERGRYQYCAECERYDDQDSPTQERARQ